MMRSRNIQWTFIFLLCLLLIGCGKTETKDEGGKTEITIPAAFLVNPDTGENENEELVDAFNEEYKGRYYLDVEWMTDTAEGYRSRIKTLNGLDKLPAVITDVGFDADFYTLLAENDRLVNLEPYITADEEWKAVYGEREMEVYGEGGKIYLSPSGNSSTSYAGFYYNKELFERAGIQDFPTDWDGFFSCLDRLKSNGITPLAIHGGSSYWTSLLISTGYIAGEPGGLGFLEKQYPKDYQNESMRDMFTVLKRLYDYADSDALHIERTESAKRFTQGEEAITANGYWMIQNFTEEEKNRIGFAPFPGSVLMVDMKMSTWAATTGYSEEVTVGAVEFLKFRALREKGEEEEYFSSQAGNQVEREYKQAVQKVKTIMPNYQLKWEAGIQEEFFVNSLPLYIEGELTEEEFLTQLNEAVQEINAEK